MLAVFVMLSGCVHPGGNGDEDTSSGGDDTVPEAPQPLAVAGWGTDAALAENDGATQGEPAAVALPDGTLLASWMGTQSDGYSLYVELTRSTDGGHNWSTPTTVDEDRWGWQNDPDFAYTAGRVYYTWLAIESTDASKGSIYCIDSTDGGVTWSDKTKLSTESTSVDREWMASDATGKVVITWDSFSGRGGYDEAQVYSESTTGCAGFSAPTTVATGMFLNGVPAIDSDGNVWASRNEFENNNMKNIISLKAGSDWQDTTIQSYSYPNGAYSGAIADRGEDDDVRPDLDARPMANLAENHYLTVHGRSAPRASARGTYDGEYCPILAAHPDGGLAIVTLGTEAGDADYADVSFFRVIDGAVTSSTILNEDGGGNAQMEPWIAVDAGGGIHATWYDASEGDWRLYGATSTDGGDSFSALPIGDNTFVRGFDETTDADFSAWVGHFQSIVTTDDHVVAVFGDSHEHGTSRIYADVSKAE